MRYIFKYWRGLDEFYSKFEREVIPQVEMSLDRYYKGVLEDKAKKWITVDREGKSGSNWAFWESVDRSPDDKYGRLKTEVDAILENFYSQIGQVERATLWHSGMKDVDSEESGSFRYSEYLRYKELSWDVLRAFRGVGRSRYGVRDLGDVLFAVVTYGGDVPGNIWWYGRRWHRNFLIHSRVFGRYDYRILQRGFFGLGGGVYPSSDFELNADDMHLCRWMKGPMMQVVRGTGYELPVAYRGLVSSGFCTGGLLDEEGRHFNSKYWLERRLIKTVLAGTAAHSMNMYGGFGFKDSLREPSSYKRWVEVVDHIDAFLNDDGSRYGNRNDGGKDVNRVSEKNLLDSDVEDLVDRQSMPRVKGARRYDYARELKMKSCDRAKPETRIKGANVRDLKEGNFVVSSVSKKVDTSKYPLLEK